MGSKKTQMEFHSSSDRRIDLIPEQMSNDEELLVKFVDHIDSKVDDNPQMFSKSNLLQASINNF